MGFPNRYGLLPVGDVAWFVRQRLSKKNGNYLGKVRTNLKRTEATIFTNDQARGQQASVETAHNGYAGHHRGNPRRREWFKPLRRLENKETVYTLL